MVPCHSEATHFPASGCRSGRTPEDQIMSQALHTVRVAALIGTALAANGSTIAAGPDPVRRETIGSPDKGITAIIPAAGSVASPLHSSADQPGGIASLV